MQAARDSWAQLDDFICVTWVSGGAFEDVVRSFGVQNSAPDRVNTTVRDEAEAILASRRVEPRLLVRNRSTWTILLEVRTCRGSADGVLVAAAQNGQALNVFANEQGTRVTYAAGGAVVHTFYAEELAEDFGMSGILEWANALGVSAHEWANHPKSAAFMLAEALTGIMVDDSWVDGDWMGVPLIGDAPPANSVVLPYEDMRQLVDLRPDIRAFVDAPTAGNVRAMKNMLARFAVARAELFHPTVTAALNALDERLSFERMEALREDMRALDQEIRQRAHDGFDIETAVRWISAAQALDAALDPSTSSLSYLACASRARSLPLNDEERLILETFDVINADIDRRVRRQSG
ncbi:hypothetical protein AB0K40_43360 [Nonomuraea bangladeshensis]|uniref:Uncharacterized protein n=1 Tax=Nonomuraea bangladeshensis TaxID=404385 RepID=A0ABV3HIL8_9ACTN